MKSHERLHQLALKHMASFLQVTKDLLEVITRIDGEQAYLELGHSSLWRYMLDGLKMSECHAHQCQLVVRKSNAVPALKAAVNSGQVSLPKAAIIARQITLQNQVEWIEKAQSLTTEALRVEVAIANPSSDVLTRVIPRSEELSELRIGLKKKTLAKLKQAQDLLCQKQRGAVSLEEVICSLADAFIKRHDKVAKAERAAEAQRALPTAQPLPVGRVARPAWVNHQVHLASQGQCEARLSDGSRCTGRRFLEVHHKRPLSQGGSNAPSNLTVLCDGHHKMQHLGARLARPFTLRAQSRIDRMPVARTNEIASAGASQ